MWKDLVNTLREWLTAQTTHPGITDVICTRLLAWKTGTPFLSENSGFLGLEAVITLQDSIGWQPFLEGCPVKGWAETQQRYYTWIGSRQTGKRWLSQVIRKAWDVVWDQWEHRNGILHSADQIVIMQYTDNAIRAEYQLGYLALPQDVHVFFRTPVESLLDSIPTVRDAWLKRVSAARARQTRSGEGYQYEQQAMAAWLQQH